MLLNIRKCADEQRAETVDFTIRNENVDPYSNIPNYDEHKDYEYFAKNGEWLLWEHLVAWHELRQINVILFVADGDKGKITVNKHLIGNHGRFRVAGILHINGNHFDYVKLPQDIDTLRALPAWNIDAFWMLQSQYRILGQSRLASGSWTNCCNSQRFLFLPRQK